jgi:competence protein ComGC
VLWPCRCRGQVAAGVVTAVVVVVVCAALLLLVIINMVRDSEAPVHAGDFLKVLIR